MAHAEDHVWRLPSTVNGKDAKPNQAPATRPISHSAKARLGRIATRAPEAIVKLTGRSRGGPAHLKAHLDYITSNGRLQAETQDGEKISDMTRLLALHDDWLLLANAAESRGRSTPNATQSVAIILSMPPGTPPDQVEAAARTWARETFVGKHDWIMARHDDTRHPHVHVTVRAVGRDGRRLAPGPADLQLWLERFARELRRLGVEAEATPRQARVVVRKTPHAAVHRSEQRGKETRVRQAERRDVEREALAPKPQQPRDWSQDIQARQESIRRAYLGHADTLAQGDSADRQLARDIHRFVADMPVPLTRRQAMAVELRRVLEQRHDKEAPSPAQPSLSNSEDLHRARPDREHGTPNIPGQSRPGGRR
ncbi:IncQ plasmid conjugative transfer DNA nicking endonuclease TraR [Candidatus Burkholderia verschuerenii]|uniref:IncQ plasmid conjugative transfer DNA nicking endonuclease TraR n=1 Tax=Candidatus Burkholderia verschuerenii TaxID=242163 RepID=A0A0L0MFM0_9BURK|nr:relaxase/mobilization nuclease domain-containing protein [Candidatus Burkholderia verschuerenii]KND61502.1 IncQ plasmid conjugative transfer DNA nicking endonuclease TraR [Candidatus Burkholderia verschuerenii]